MRHLGGRRVDSCHIDRKMQIRAYFYINYMGKDAVYIKLKGLMSSEFELDADSISPEKRLEDDLDLDSLDMVDLILSLNDHIDEKIDPTLFKDARTVQDLVDLIQPLWK